MTGSGVPGNGVFVQSAKAHSLEGSGTRAPSSEVRRVRIACDVSKEAGVAVPVTRPRMIDSVVDPAFMSANRAITGPVMLDPSAFRATGVTMVSTPGPGAMSACQPLVTSTWPASRKSAK